MNSINCVSIESKIENIPNLNKEKSTLLELQNLKNLAMKVIYRHDLKDEIAAEYKKAIAQFIENLVPLQALNWLKLDLMGNSYG